MTVSLIRLALAASLALVVLPAAGARASTSLTIRVTSVTVKVVRHDVAPKGASKGDRVIDRDRLLNAAAKQFGKKKGAVVGKDSATMTFTSAHTAKIKGTAVLPGGTLRLGGNVVGLANGGLLITVVGGTGRYSGARGTLTVGVGNKRALNTYRLLLPSAPVA